MTLDDLTQHIGNVLLYGGTSVGLVWLFAQKTAERWVDSHFAKRQKEFEHEQAKELQRIKAKLDTVIQGSLKLQEREFKIIPEAWEKIGELYGLARWLCSPMQQYAHLEYLNTEELEEFLGKQDALSNSHRRRIREASPDLRDKLWQDLDTRVRRNRVQNALVEADSHLKANSVFIPDSLRERFEKEVQIIHHALASFDTGTMHGAKQYKYIADAWEKLQNEAEPLHKEIEKAVRRRLLEQSQLNDD